MNFEPVIGLEVHAHLKTDTKIFCSCSTKFGAPPNTHVCPVCLGMPGVLPVLNKKVVEYAMRMAFATNCEIAGESRFARKNYFYPDLPKGYQISQFELPIAEHGHVDISLPNSTKKRIGITRIHMEEDAGKSIHDPGRPVSFVDLNRTGVPLIEIVSEPDLASPEEAGAYLRQIRMILRYLSISDGNMEEGSFRCDANISVRPAGQTELGTRAELKNINSFKFVEKALAYEIKRQISVITGGGRVIQETRLWDTAKNRTNSMRGKEEAHDYRYFPDPDLVPLVIDDAWMDAVKKSLPELPDARRARFISDFDLSEYDADLLTADRKTADYFEACIATGAPTKLCANWIMGELAAALNARGKSIDQSPIPADALAKLLCLITDNVISGKIAKTVFEEMIETGKPAQTIVEEKGLVQVSDASAIEAVIDEVMTNNPDEVEKYRAGKKKLMGFFVGQVMRATKGKANPGVVNKILTNKLS
ncbi:MAG: Asp-tRNA(Asn)/Glu-tRNA(Gln) amidotransferase subunit GatB [Deltaproteobacteria bacterium]|nr:Asp-tRNA(Asn)/Glu-tRNA(Gln) amidotransferase subunit GatB [Deltaproteobacteria bacterium]